MFFPINFILIFIKYALIIRPHNKWYIIYTVGETGLRNIEIEKYPMCFAKFFNKIISLMLPVAGQSVIIQFTLILQALLDDVIWIIQNISQKLVLFFPSKLLLSLSDQVMFPTRFSLWFLKWTSSSYTLKIILVMIKVKKLFIGMKAIPWNRIIILTFNIK